MQSLSCRDLYLITHSPFISLGNFGKWLKVVPYPKTDFGTLGTSLRKFGTFNRRVSGTPIYLPMIHIIIWWPSGSVIRCHSSPQNRLWSFMYILKKFWYIQSLGYQDPYFRFCGPFVPLGTLGQWLEVVSCPQNKLWNSRYIFKKIWYIKSSSY